MCKSARNGKSLVKWVLDVVQRPSPQLQIYLELFLWGPPFREGNNTVTQQPADLSCDPSLAADSEDRVDTGTVDITHCQSLARKCLGLPSRHEDNSIRLGDHAN